MRLPGPMVFLYFIFSLAFIAPVSNLLSHPSRGGTVSFPPVPPALIVCGPLADGHSASCEVIPRGELDFHLFNNELCGTCFPVIFCLCVEFPSEIGFLKIWPVLRCSSTPSPRTCLEGPCHLQARNPCEMPQSASTKVWL